MSARAPPVHPVVASGVPVQRAQVDVRDEDVDRRPAALVTVFPVILGTPTDEDTLMPSPVIRSNTLFVTEAVDCVAETPVVA